MAPNIKFYKGKTVKKFNRPYNRTEKGKGAVKILKRSVPLWVLAVAVLAVVSVAIAAVIISRDISTHMNVVGVKDMKFYDYWGNEFTFIEFGDVTKGETKYYPEDPYYMIKNTGDYPYYVSWTVTGWPPGVTIKIYVNKGTWNSPPEDNYELAQGEIYSEVINPGEYLYWSIKIEVGSDAEIGEYTPTITWTGYDSPSG